MPATSTSTRQRPPASQLVREAMRRELPHLYPVQEDHRPYPGGRHRLPETDAEHARPIVRPLLAMEPTMALPHPVGEGPTRVIRSRPQPTERLPYRAPQAAWEAAREQHPTPRRSALGSLLGGLVRWGAR